MAVTAEREEVSRVERIEVEPQFNLSELFSQCSVCFHYALNPEREDLGAIAGLTRAGIFDSFERDLLAHIFRDNNVIRSRTICLPNGTELEDFTVEVVFPRELHYAAEGKRKILHFHGRNDTISFPFKCRITGSEFPSPNERDQPFFGQHLILHVTLLRDEEEAQVSFSEYDLIQLIKLWEGGEDDVIDEQNTQFVAHQIEFITQQQRFPTLAKLISHALLSRCQIDSQAMPELGKPLCGTIQLNLSSDQEQRFQHVFSLIRNEPPQEELIAEAQHILGDLKAIAGILQGLLDFPYIGWPELVDVFRQSTLDIELARNLNYLAIHKGTLLNISMQCRLMALEEVRQNIGMSPYLVIPQSLLAHHENMLRLADASLKKSSASRRSRSFQLSEIEIQNFLNQRWLPNIFHYPTERLIYESGHHSRGLLARREQILGQTSYFTARVKAYHSEGIAKWGLYIAFAGTAIGLLAIVCAYLTAANNIGANIVRLSKGIDPFDLSNIKKTKMSINGSRMMYAFIRDIVDQYEGSQAAIDTDFEVKNDNSKVGFALFCKDQLTIAASSRKMKSREMDLCRFNGVDYLEPFHVATDSFAIIARAKSLPSDELTLPEMGKIISSDGPVRLSDIRSGWPDSTLMPCKVQAHDAELSSRMSYFYAMFLHAKPLKTLFFEEVFPRSGTIHSERQCPFLIVGRQVWSRFKSQGVSYYTQELRLNPGDESDPRARDLYLYVSTSQFERSPEVRRFLRFFFQASSKAARANYLDSVDPRVNLNRLHTYGKIRGTPIYNNNAPYLDISD